MKLNPFVPLELRKEKKKDQITESRSFSGKLKTMQRKKKIPKNAKVKTLGIKKLNRENFKEQKTEAKIGRLNGKWEDSEAEMFSVQSKG